MCVCKALHNHTNETHLRALAIIFVLAGERRLVEAFHHLPDSLSGVRQHGPQGYAWHTEVQVKRGAGGKEKDGKRVHGHSR